MTDDDKRSRVYLEGTAHCLLTYVSSDGERETLWNSREGLVPVKLTLANGDVGKVQQDALLNIHYVPAIGERVFVNYSETRARQVATEIVMQLEADNAPALHKSFRSRDEAVASAANWYTRNAVPDVITVTAGWRQALIDARDELIASDSEQVRLIHGEAAGHTNTPDCPICAERVRATLDTAGRLSRLHCATCGRITVLDDDYKGPRPRFGDQMCCPDCSAWSEFHPNGSIPVAGPSMQADGFLMRVPAGTAGIRLTPKRDRN
jgi:hypothetical protein